jgi:hypothetical protein
LSFNYLIAAPFFYYIIELSPLTLYDQKTPERLKKMNVDAQDWKCLYLKTRQAGRHITGRNTTHHLEHKYALRVLDRISNETKASRFLVQ